MWAVVNEYYEVAKVLVELGAGRVNADIADSSGKTVLDIACRRGVAFEKLFWKDLMWD